MTEWGITVHRAKKLSGNAKRMGLNSIILGENEHKHLFQDATLYSGKGETSKQNTYTAADLLEGRFWLWRCRGQGL